MWLEKELTGVKACGRGNDNNGIKQLLKDEFAVYCSSGDEYDELRCVLHELGFKWNSGKVLNKLDYLGWDKAVPYLMHCQFEPGIRRGSDPEFSSSAFRIDNGNVFDFESFMQQYIREERIPCDINIKMLFDEVINDV